MDVAAARSNVAPSHDLDDRHTVQFYESETELVSIAGRFLTSGLQAGDSLILATTPPHARMLSSFVEAHCPHLPGARLPDRLIVVDAQSGLDYISHQGIPEQQRFRNWLMPVLRRALSASRSGRVCVFGELVSLLARAGNYRAALTLEGFWNQLLLDLPMSLFCSYRLSDFPRAGDLEHFRCLCREHRRVHSTTPASVVNQPSRLQQRLAELEQRASALTAEVQERKRLESELQKAQQDLTRASKLEAIGRLSAGVAHDFNNLLMAVDFTAELLLAERLPLPQRLRAAEEIKATAKRAATLVRQLLAFNGMGAQRASLLSLEQAIRDMHALLRRLLDARIELQLDLDPAAAGVLADPTRFEQMLLNLAINAAEAMPSGGKLTLRTRRLELGSEPSPFTALPPGTYALLEVEDTGIGMCPETLANVFEPFFSSKEHRPGSGLGLTTVLAIVTQAGGQILVDSTPGAGSCFRIALPLLQLPPEAADAVPCGEPAQRAGARPLTILLAEDEHTIRSLMVETLEAWGHRVFAATDGIQAERLAASLDSLDLFITDLIMPGRTGSELAAALLAHRPTVRVIYMTGYAERGIACRAHAERCEFLQKPFSRVQLAAAIDRFQRLD